ncbi:uncharacterized protein LOC126841376 [Adelges cooleyi]|uniref:uncharacterized protein LOC126841376 n=1 Tax=Adelges cooleyi TaxID=133065 RepID=UPI00217FFA36|nr:uncharacterized protein LOC126841376 [Adelges cooleyi]
MYFKLTFFLVASVLIAKVVGPETVKMEDFDVTDLTIPTEKLENELMRRIFVSILSENKLPYNKYSTISVNMFREYLKDSEMSDRVLNIFRASGSLNNVTGQITLEEFMHLIRSATELSRFNTINEFTKPLKLNVGTPKE